MKTDPAEWSVVGSTALGGRHVRTGAPNQDASLWRRFSHARQEMVVMAVGDGHGGDRYVRSDVGSRLAVEVACDVAQRAVEDGLLAGSVRQIEKRAASQVVAAIVREWTAACLDHLSGQPFTIEEEERTGTSLDEEPLLAYGSTLLLAVLGGGDALLMQLGDGDCLVATADGKALSPIASDDRLTGSETTSLCLPTAVEDFRVAVANDLDPTMVLLATDGYGVAFAAPDWRQTVLEDLLGEFQNRGPAYVEGMLPGWLADSARVGGDDATAVVAFRPAGKKARPGSPGRGLRAVGSVAAGLGLILVAGAAGWALGTSRPEGDTSVPPTTAATVTTLLTPTTPSTLPTSTVPTSTVPPTTRPPVAVPGAPLGSVAWIVGPGGQVVEFVPVPDDAQPRLVSVTGQTAPLPAPSQVYAGEQVWSVIDGVLHADGQAVTIATEATVRFGTLEVEGSHLWALTEAGDWLVAFELSGAGTCWLHRVEPDEEQAGAAQSPPAAPPECGFETSPDF